MRSMQHHFLSSTASAGGHYGAVNPMGHAAMRTSNMGLVLRHLYDSGPRSRATLAAEVGLSKATISTLVGELSARGLVTEGEADRQGRVGRPGIEVAVDGSAVCGIGVEITVEYIAVAIVDLAGQVRASHSVPMPTPEPENAVQIPATPPTAESRAGFVPSDPAHALDHVAAQVTRALDIAADEGLWPAGILVAPPGIIDYASGVVRFAPNLGWRNVPLLHELRTRLGVGAPPIGLENDAKLSAVAAYAEMGRDEVQDLVYLTGDVGVGAGIISGGRLVRGWSGFSGEVGHVTVVDGGEQCPCGRRGCWELYVGLGALLAALPEDAPANDPHLPMPERLANVREFLEAENPGVLAAFESIGAQLARGAGLLVDVLNPRAMVLGGYLGYFADVFQEPLAAALEARLIDEGSAVEVMQGLRGLEAAAVGGALVVLDSVLADPTLVPLAR